MADSSAPAGLKAQAEKEIGRMEAVFKELKVVNADAMELYNLAVSYFSDSKHFFAKEDFLRAFEAAVIAWAYCDAGLHLRVFEVPEALKKDFTV
ncbi:MAG: DUF357 domain-containing protein [Candidatus Aenigmarchaeota archaeon]|nr:DUF357 domain-containing protein [Candidatus Aenigmarchaeota archaeon]